MATVTYIKEKKQHISVMVAVMKYCAQEKKTYDELTQQRLVSGINCDGGNAITEFLATQAAYNKMDGISTFSPSIPERTSPRSRHTRSLKGLRRKHGRDMKCRCPPTAMPSTFIPIS